MEPSSFDARPAGARAGWRSLLVVGMLAALPQLAAASWQRAYVEPTVDGLEALLRFCETRRAEVLERHRAIDEWAAYQTAYGVEVDTRLLRPPVPECDARALVERLGARHVAVWAMASSAEDGLLFATVNLPVPGILVSTDGGDRWRYRHAFVRGYNIEHRTLVRGLDFRHGLLAVASDLGVLLSEDGGLTFSTALADRPFTAVAISPRSREVIVAAGPGASFLSTDRGESWVDLDFTGFVRNVTTDNPHLNDYVLSLQVDPRDPRTAYVGTGSHLYRVIIEGPETGRWQAMEGRGGRAARVHDDSTVYNIAIGNRFMISTCNGVYVLQSLSPQLAADQAEVIWGKFRDGLFTNRGVGGPKGNLRSYYVTEDPADRSRILIADFAGVYEGLSEQDRVRWRRVEGLPFHSPEIGYPEYTAIAWARDGRAVVGSRRQGIFVEDGASRRWLAPVRSSALARAITGVEEWAPAVGGWHEGRGIHALPWSAPAPTPCSSLAP